MPFRTLFLLLFVFLGETLFSQTDPVLMTINGNPVTLSEFAYSYRKSQQNAFDRISLEEYVRMYIDFKLKVQEALALGMDKTPDFRQEYARYVQDFDQASGKNNPENRYLLQEYRDGMLLFAFMNEQVWEKAQTDEKGLKEYFETHEKNYRWKQPGYKGMIVMCHDEYSKNKTNELFKTNPEDLPSAIRHEQETDSRYVVKTESGVWQKGQNEFVDYSFFDGDMVPATGDDFPYFVIAAIRKDQPSFEDVRSAVINDYQQYLEKETMKRLRKKYTVKVNKRLLKRLK